MSKKYEILTDESILVGDVELYRIRALKDFADVKTGDLGGFIQREENLSQDGLAWVYNDAKVYDNARIEDFARIYDYAKVCGNARIFGNAWVCDDAYVYDNAKVYGDALVYDYGCVGGDEEVCGKELIYYTI